MTDAKPKPFTDVEIAAIEHILNGMEPAFHALNGMDRAFIARIRADAEKLRVAETALYLMVSGKCECDSRIRGYECCYEGCDAQIAAHDALAKIRETKP